MYNVRTIQKYGGSLVATIPAHIVGELGIKPGDQVRVERHGDGAQILLTILGVKDE